MPQLPPADSQLLQWQRKKDCYFEPLFILARGLSLIALALSLVALSLVALTLVALTLVALTPAKSVALIALIAAISVIPLICASSSLLLSRSLLSRSLLSRSLLSRSLLSRSLLGRCLLGCKLLRGNVIGGRDGTCGLPSLCRHGLSWQTSRLSQKIIQTGQESA